MSEGTRKWLLAIDVDRTLLTADYRLLPEVRLAVRHARDNGITVALVTARGPQALEIVMRELGGIDYAVCFGGALTVTRENGAWLRHASSAEKTLDREVCGELVEYCRMIDLSLAFYGREVVHVDGLDAHLANEFRYTGDIYEIGDLLGVGERPYKFLAICSPDRVDKLDAVRTRFAGRLSCAMSHPTYLEIGLEGVSKGTGLAALGRALSIGPERTVAIGDGENDLSMFDYAGLSVAMGNAPLSVRSAATWVTKSNAEAGVAVAIERLSRDLWHIPAPNYRVEASE